MSDPLRFAFQFANNPTSRPGDPAAPMRMLVIADLSGSELETCEEKLLQGKIQRIDIDNFEDLLAAKLPSIQFPSDEYSESANKLEISTLEDFHPENILLKLPAFTELLDLRKRLVNPKTSTETIAILNEALPHPQSKSVSGSSDKRNTDNPTESNEETVKRVLGTTSDSASHAGTFSAEPALTRMIRNAIAPHIVPGPDHRLDDYLQSIDSEISTQLREILHNDAFQSLEASWRGLYFLVSNVETTEDLQVYVWDVSKRELIQAIESEGDRLEDSLLFQRLVLEREETPWSIIVSDLSFGTQSQDLTLLSSLGAVAAHSESPFLATAGVELTGHEPTTDSLLLSGSKPDFDTAEKKIEMEHWSALRSSPVASWIGLVAPRFLLRLPYGSNADPIDLISFEEIEEPNSQHQEFLWGAPALICGTLLATSFLESQWLMTANDNLEFGDLPFYSFKSDGETTLLPCAEFYLNERESTLILDRGIMPLLSYKNRNAVKLLRMQSIAYPATSLSGPWAKSTQI